MTNYAKMTEKIILEVTTLAKKKRTNITPELLLEASENIRKPRNPAPPKPRGGISLSAAERKYRIHKSTLSRWLAKNYIPVVLRTKREVYVDEAALVELVKKYRQDPGQGKSTVKPDDN